LISLEEAQERVLGGVLSAALRQKYIEVGPGPAALPQYHTIIDHPRE